VAWQTADDERILPPYVPAIPRETPPLKTVARSAAQAPAAPPPAGTDAGEATFSAGRFSVAVLEGTVAISGLGFRDALRQVDALVADIGKIEGFRAAVIDSPLDVTPNVAIQGRFGNSDPAQSRARFSVKVSRALEPRP
jgi:hypothetical protein